MTMLATVKRQLKGPLIMTLAMLCQPVTADELAELMEKGQTAFNRADIVDAMRWYRLAADKGHVAAQVRLAQLLDYSEQNELAIEWYRKAVAQNSAQAQYELGGMIAAGDGVEKDNAQALALFEQSADQGYLPAVRLLAVAYEKGQLGLEADPARAIAFIEKGIAAGDAWSVERMARAYELGQLGLAPDPAKAGSLRTQSGASKTDASKKK